mmetsp:Transcript_101899/g.292390  ORF Transcript_101899/g.292390 Transcript_101899/m.292390 type:complete len:250 (-) Transcript_101899:1079-1828(-)
MHGAPDAGPTGLSCRQHRLQADGLRSPIHTDHDAANALQAAAVVAAVVAAAECAQVAGAPADSQLRWTSGGLFHHLIILLGLLITISAASHARRRGPRPRQPRHAFGVAGPFEEGALDDQTSLLEARRRHRVRGAHRDGGLLQAVVLGHEDLMPIRLSHRERHPVLIRLSGPLLDLPDANGDHLQDHQAIAPGLEVAGANRRLNIRAVGRGARRGPLHLHRMVGRQLQCGAIVQRNNDPRSLAGQKPSI